MASLNQDSRRSSGAIALERPPSSTSTCASSPCYARAPTPTCPTSSPAVYRPQPCHLPVVHEAHHQHQVRSMQPCPVMHKTQAGDLVDSHGHLVMLAPGCDMASCTGDLVSASHRSHENALEGIVRRDAKGNGNERMELEEENLVI